jgi:hypothetical protein
MLLKIGSMVRYRLADLQQWLSSQLTGGMELLPRLMKTFGKRQGSWSFLVFAAVSMLFELLTGAVSEIAQNG